MLIKITNTLDILQHAKSQSDSGWKVLLPEEQWCLLSICFG